MPYGSSNRYILAQEEGAGRSFRFARIVIVASDDWKALGAGVPVDLTVALGQILISHIVKGFVNWQAPGIGMVAAKKAPGAEKNVCGNCGHAPPSPRSGGNTPALTPPGKVLLSRTSTNPAAISACRMAFLSLALRLAR